MTDLQNHAASAVLPQEIHAAIAGPVVMIGFGSIGRGLLPLMARHIGFDPARFTVIDPDDSGRAIAESFGVRFVQQAIEYEARRQVEVIEAGGTITQETRLFDTKNGTTRSMRSKEDAHDYRYFPDPDLLPLVLDPAFVDGIKNSLPELPDAKKKRFIAMGLSNYDASVLTGERERAV